MDLNRNYGVLWGGPGTSSDIDDLTFHGTGPFSEPETEAFRRFMRDIQPAVAIGNHTFTGLILRPPGTADQSVEDEPRMRALGDKMAYETDYISQFGYQLYDTTGTADDYIYGALNGYAYTPEIGKAEFHPAYTTGFIPEYEGRVINGVKRGGLREAFTLAGLTAIDPDSHSIITGTAPAGSVLTITTPVSYQTSAEPNDDGVQNPVQTLNETRRTSLTVDASGTFEWHVNPSRQPGGDPKAWTLTCGSETRQLYVERDQTVNVGLTCGQVAAGAPAPAPAAPAAPTCQTPQGFRRVDVQRRGSGLRVTFSRFVANRVTVDIYQTSKGRKVIATKRVKRYTNRNGSFNWNGRATGNKRLSDGIYYVQVRMTDASRRVDSRRVVVERKNGRFTKRGNFTLTAACG